MRPNFVARCALLFLPLTLVLARGAGAQVCDPPGPPPRFACSWSLETCDWICPICDPFGGPPRTSCTWSGTLCNWVCPGWSGVDVTVDTKKGPTHDATVYVTLSSLCTATGAGGFCSDQFAVTQGMPIAAKCAAIANAVTNACAAAGYAVTTDDCAAHGTLIVSNVGCPETAFVLGLSNDDAVFDQTERGQMPDGENDDITGTPKNCTPRAGAVGNLQLEEMTGGAQLHFSWDDTSDATDYVIYTDTSPTGSFATVAGTAADGATGWTTAMPAGEAYFLVAGRNASCGPGPKH